MKKTLTRCISALLVFAMVLSFIPAFSIDVKAAPTWSTNQQNIAARADYFYETTWVCQKTIMGWRDQYTFYEGETYHLPYGQPVNSGKFIEYGVTLEDFLIAAADADSVFYSRQSEYNGWTSTYYANDCSSFVAICWGTVRQDCSTIPYYSTYKGAANLSNIKNVLQLGDCLDSTSVGHVVLVTDMTYDSNGNLTQIEITEQTPPQLKRSYYTPSELANKYGTYYSIYRYEGAVPAAPERGYTSDCTRYDSYCKIKITEDTDVMSLPCSAGVDEESTLIKTAAADEVYTATRLYMNTEGELWYRVQLEDDEEGYVAAGNTEYLEQILDDITISGATTPNGHVKGKTFAVKGNITSEYNRLTYAAVYIHDGFGIDGDIITGKRDAVTSNAYTLLNSTIDYNTSFGDVPLGEHTYSIYTEYQNYYATGSDTFEMNSGTVYLVEDYFMVVSSSVSQTSCSHSNSDTVIKDADCTTDGTTVTACSKCGLVSETTVAAFGHAYGDWTSIDATCTADGSKTRTCSACGDVETQIIAASGHSYDLVIHEASCQEYEIYEYTCNACGDNYKLNAGEMISQWLEAIPDGLDASLFETKTQYRYADCTSTSWEQIGTGTVSYVNSWPSGFDTGNSLYAQYNNKDSKISASETETTKTAITSDKVAGYLYYHWCRDGYLYSVATQQGSYNRFHAFYSATDPGNYDCDTSDMSYNVTDSTACDDCQWYFVAEVYDQNYATYEKVNDGKEWGDWSAWSDTVYTPVENSRKVETRTVYRLENAELGDHNYVNGVCTVCGETDGSYDPDYYLVGLINGADYGCESDRENLGQYKFVDGSLTVTFESDSYVYVKTGDNGNWYMAQSDIADSSAVLYHTSTGSNGKLFVPGGVEVIFTLVVNDDTLNLSYAKTECAHPGHDTDGFCVSCGEAVEHSYADGTCTVCGKECVHDYLDGVCAVCGKECAHDYVDGTCTVCGKKCAHDYVDGTCTVCGKECSHDYLDGTCTVCGQAKPCDYYLFGFINGANYGCGEDYENMGAYLFVNGSLTTTFAENSYVAVKTGDNGTWYMSEGFTEGAMTVTLYNTANGIRHPEKLFVPGGVEITFTLVVNDDGSLTLSYEVAEPAAVSDSKDIKWQVTSGTNADSASTNLRLVSWVDSVDNYSSVTFNVTINGATAPLVCTTAYTAIKASGLSISNPAGVFGEESANYFVTHTIMGIPAGLFDSEILVTVTWTDLEGNSVTSDVEAILISSDWT